MSKNRADKTEREFGTVINAVGERIRKFFHLKEDWYNRPIVAVGLAGLTFFVGTGAGIVVEKELANYIWPDPAAQKVEKLQARITEKTNTIETTLNSMETSIEDANIESPEAKKFVRNAKTLKQELTSLKPDLATFSQEADQLAREITSAKISQIQDNEKSRIADFVLPQGGAMTVCQRSITVGYPGTDGDDDAHINVSTPSENLHRELYPGQGVRFETPKQRVLLTFRGFQENQQYARMDFECDIPEA